MGKNWRTRELPLADWAGKLPKTHNITFFNLTIDIVSLQNRLLKICCVPTTSASLPRVRFFFSFLFLLQWPFTVLIKQTRQAVHAIKQSIFLDVYELDRGRFVKNLCHTLGAQKSVTKFKELITINSVTLRAPAKNELLFNKPASEHIKAELSLLKI
jgi:hypothetical protein